MTQSILVVDITGEVDEFALRSLRVMDPDHEARRLHGEPRIAGTSKRITDVCPTQVEPRFAEVVNT